MKKSEAFVTVNRCSNLSRSRSRWLTLSEAAQKLGVHATTLRRWADEGAIRCLRTPGGHRRFLEADVHAFIRSQIDSVDQRPSGELERALILHTRHEMESKNPGDVAWLTAFDEEERAARRESGRRLVGLAIQFTSRSKGHEKVLDDGRRTGRQYGWDAAEHGLSLVDTAQAFLFFRETLISSAQGALPARHWYDEESAYIRRGLGQFLDEVLLAAIAAYEERRWSSDRGSLGPE